MNLSPDDAEGVSDMEELNNVRDRVITLKNKQKSKECVDKLTKFVDT